ncbi:hypothetical protein K3495_g1488 [Podosphaera aphanis]|nr:hypothetical protein K3495_g1488 [Podosphaera aphanis]
MVEIDNEKEQEQTRAMNEELKVNNGQKVLPKSAETRYCPKRVTTRPKRFLDGYEYYLNNDEDLDDQFIAALETNVASSMAFLSSKEKHDCQLSIKLRQEGVITTPGAPFGQSQTLEIDGLIARGVFEFVKFDPKEHNGLRIFNSRLVNEIKGKATKSPYEKSRLLVQVYDDQGKEAILTQSPTIQRVSQRLIIALAPSLAKIGYNLYLRDITQAYIQSTTLLKRTILAQLPKQIRV